MVGSVATIMVMLASQVAMGEPVTIDYIVFSIFFLPFVWVVWLFGVTFLGLPVWHALYDRVPNRRWAAVVTGAVMVGGVWALAGAPSGNHVEAGIPGMLCGALAGLMFEGAAHRGWCLRKAGPWAAGRS